ncbi:unnamed protein product [Peronospora belbahrii]|uniref:Reverse transcriptase n=1 Tax=Peronospora belbahrii TaxID=622444 RepID=A0ABN8D1L3_9STRA|nr:unnamed protein product [Peronospora belbahrii]
MRQENDFTSLNTVSGVGVCKTRCQDTSPSDRSDEELTLEGRAKSQMDVVFENNEVHAPNDEVLTHEGGVQSVNEVVFDLEVCTPMDANDASDSESILSSDDDIVSDGDSKKIYALVNGLAGNVEDPVALSAGPAVSGLLELDELSFAEFCSASQAGDIAEVVVLRPEGELSSSSLLDKAVLEDTKKALNACSGSQILNDPSDPYFPLLKEYGDVVSKEPPKRLSLDICVRHEIALVPGTKYYVMRQWPLPRKQCNVIDEFFRAKHAAGMVRETTIPAQTPIPRKDVLQNNMVGCAMYSALDLVDGYYQLLMRASNIPLTAVSTSIGMLWEWLVMSKDV